MYLIRAARPDLVIPMPSGLDLPAKGIVLGAVDLYWTRRSAEGDVTIDVVEADEIDDAIAEADAAGAAAARAAAAAAQAKGRSSPSAAAPSTSDTAAEQKG